MNGIRMIYTNWKGETRLRHVRPIAIEFMETKWHPEEQWILTALDLEKNEVREFALKLCNFDPMKCSGPYCPGT